MNELTVFAQVAQTLWTFFHHLEIKDAVLDLK